MLTQVLSEKAKTNLEKLETLLDETIESDRLFKADVLRQLGRLEEAKNVLSLAISLKHGYLFKQLYSLCEKKDTCLRELCLEE